MSPWEFFFGSTPTIVVKPNPATEWTVREFHGFQMWEGNFVVFSGEGKIILSVAAVMMVREGEAIHVYIRNPPESLKNHEHGSCFQLAEPKSDWLRLHWEKPAMNLDAARSYVEGLLEECICEIR